MAIHSLIPWRREPRELTRANDPFTYLRRQIDRIFEEPLGAWRGPWQSGETMFAPNVDVTEHDKDISVSAELPGLESKDVEVDVDDDVLTIRGEKRSEETSGEAGHRWTERTFGRFERSIPLPMEVNPDAAKAEFRNGVLRITLPKSETAKSHARKININ
ncbi:MAG TPA: Hsp20/alpha crystallin family protein [Chthoniobacterales bacterium]